MHVEDSGLFMLTIYNGIVFVIDRKSVGETLNFRLKNILLLFKIFFALHDYYSWDHTSMHQVNLVKYFWQIIIVFKLAKFMYFVKHFVVDIINNTVWFLTLWSNLQHKNSSNSFSVLVCSVFDRFFPILEDNNLKSYT